MSNQIPSSMPTPGSFPMTVVVSVQVVDPQGARHHVVGPTYHVEAMQRAVAKQASAGSGRLSNTDSAEIPAGAGMSMGQLRSNYAGLLLHLVDPQYGEAFDVDLTPFEHLGDESLVEIDYLYTPISGPVAMK
jgi:hypothetical protein